MYLLDVAMTGCLHLLVLQYRTIFHSMKYELHKNLCLNIPYTNFYVPVCQDLNHRRLRRNRTRYSPWKTENEDEDTYPKCNRAHHHPTELIFHSYNSTICVDSLKYVDNPNREIQHMSIQQICMTKILIDDKPCIKAIAQIGTDNQYYFVCRNEHEL